MNGEWKTISLPTVDDDMRSMDAYCDEVWALHESPEEMGGPEYASWCVTDLSTSSVTFLVPSLDTGKRIVDLAHAFGLSYANEDGVQEMIILCHHMVENEIEAYIAKPDGNGMATLFPVQQILMDAIMQSMEWAQQEDSDENGGNNVN